MRLLFVYMYVCVCVYEPSAQVSLMFTVVGDAARQHRTHRHAQTHMHTAVHTHSCLISLKLLYTLFHLRSQHTYGLPISFSAVNESEQMSVLFAWNPESNAPYSLLSSQCYPAILKPRSTLHTHTHILAGFCINSAYTKKIGIRWEPKWCSWHDLITC